MTCAVCGKEIVDPAAGCPACETARRFAPAGVVASRYRLVRLIGAGGMGQVYHAHDLRLDQPVALKFLSRALDQIPHQRQRFLDEVRFARQVGHPNVCQVYDVGETDGQLFLSMELVDGEDLRTRLQRTGRLPYGEAVAVTVQVCRGLAAIHDRGLLHRDLKPANVLLDTRGQARLTDFGLVAQAGSAAGGAAFGGTCAYMAPEQLLGMASTMRSDLYSLGLLVYEVFTGERAYPSHALRELVRCSWGDKSVELPQPALAHEADLDPTVRRVVRWCLATEPRGRPASAEAVASALLPDAGHEPGTFLTTILASDPEVGTGGADPAPLLAEHGGHEVRAGHGRVWLFERPWGAVGFALAWRRAGGPAAALARIAVHLGEVVLEAHGQDRLTAGGAEVDAARRLAGGARPGQTLLSAHAFDLARHHAVGDGEPGQALRWLSHGRYRLPGDREAREVFEVGVEGSAPLLPPEDLERIPADGFLPGWRPAPGVAIPERPGFRVERKLGEGGFGDVWLARHDETGVSRVFKFCYDRERLRALKREIMIFRLLKEELGERPDITRVVDWSFDEAPYFIESEYTTGGSLPEWAEAQGGIARVPLELRLEIVAQVATALAAAHSVGVLHKDVKPANVLIAPREDGEVEAQLSDFGLGAVIDRGRLLAAGITVTGLTETDTTAGTRLYLAPELLEGKAPTIHTDVYALGVVLYQVVVGDLSRALGPGWQRDLDDELLRLDVAAAVDGARERRLPTALELADRLRSLAARREEREAERRARRRAERARVRRRATSWALVVLAVFATVTSILAWRVAREAERAEREAKAAGRVVDFMVSIFEDTDPFEGGGDATPGELHTARDILDRGARRLETELLDEPEIRGRLFNTVGRVYQRLGLYAMARSFFEDALELRREHLDEDDPAVAESLHDLASVLRAEGDNERAETILRDLLAVRRKSLGDHLYVANTLHDLAWTLNAKRDYDGALRAEQEALAMKRLFLPEVDRSIAASLNHLSLLYLAKRDADAAEPYAREALEITRRLWGEHPDVAESLNSLASVLLAKGDAAGAGAAAREALEMRRRLLGDEHPAVAQSLHDLAWVHYLKGDTAGAEALFEESLALYRRVTGEGSPGVLMCLHNLGRFYTLTDQPEKAAEAARRLAAAGSGP